MKKLISLGVVLGIAATIAISARIKNADASRNSSGTYSLPSGNPVVTGTTISSSWANNTMGDISSEITNSLDRSGRGAMLAPLALPNGTSSQPSMCFSSERNTGFYRAGTNDFRLQMNSTTLEKYQPSAVTITGTLTVNEVDNSTEAIIGNGNVAGTGVIGVGGASNGNGVRGSGNGSGTGVVGFGGSSAGNGMAGTGGASSGIGVLGTGGTTNGTGVYGQGTGTGNGVRGVGGATAGAVGGNFTGGSGGGNGISTTATGDNKAGISASGGSGVNCNGGTFTAGASGHGVSGTGTGTGVGILGVGGASGAGGDFTPGTHSTAGGTQYSGLNVEYGNIAFTNVQNPSSGFGPSNTITPKNIIKAWVRFVANSVAHTVSITDGFNVSGCTSDSGAGFITCSFTLSMSDTNYAVIGSAAVGTGDSVFSPSAYTTGSFSFYLYDGAGSARDCYGAYNCAGSAMVIGAN